MSLIMRWRNGLTVSSVMGMLLLAVKLRTAPHLSVTAPPAPLAAAPSRASGLVLWHGAVVRPRSALGSKADGLRRIPRNLTVDLSVQVHPNRKRRVSALAGRG